MNGRLYYILAFFSPLLGLIFSLRRGAPEKTRWIVLMFFCVFFGLNFKPAYSGLDSSKHYEEYLEYHKFGFSKLKEHFIGLKTGQSDPELYVPISYYLASRFSGSMSFFFGFHALVYSLFFVGSLRLVRMNHGDSLRGFSFVIFLYIIFLFPIHQINAIRWYMAMWCFVYCFLKVMYGDRRYLFISILSGLIHFTMYIPAILLIIVHFMHFRPYTLLVLLSLSFLIPRITTDEIFFYKDIIGVDSIENRATTYTAENYLQSRQLHLDDLNWYVSTRYTVVNLFLIICGLLFLRKHLMRLGKIRDYFNQKFLTFLLLWATIANLTFDIPSLGNRIRYLLWILLAIFLFTHAKNIDIRRKSFLNLFGIIVIGFYAIVDFRSYSANVAANWLFGNPLLLGFFSENITLSDVVFFWE